MRGSVTKNHLEARGVVAAAVDVVAVVAVEVAGALLVVAAAAMAAVAAEVAVVVAGCRCRRGTSPLGPWSYGSIELLEASAGQRPTSSKA